MCQMVIQLVAQLGGADVPAGDANTPVGSGGVLDVKPSPRFVDYGSRRVNFLH